MTRAKLILLFFLMPVFMQIFAADSTKVFVLGTVEKTVKGQWDSLIHDYHPEDVEFLGKILLKVLEGDSEFRKSFYGKDIEFEEIQNKDYSALSAKYFELTTSQIFKLGIKIDSVEFLGEVPESDSTSQCILKMDVSIDTVKRSAKQMVTVCKYKGELKLRLEENDKIRLSKLDLGYNDSRGCNFESFNLTDKLLFIGYPDLKEDYQSSSENSEVMVYDFNKKEVIRITKDLCRDSDPAWYPDGSKIFFVSKRPYKGGFAENGDSHICSLDLQTKKIIRYDKELYSLFPEKLGTQCDKPVWAKDKKLYFVTTFFKLEKYDVNNVSDGIDNVLYEFDENSKTLTFIDSTFSDSRISEDGKYLYYNKNTHLNNKFKNENIVLDRAKKEKLILPDSLDKYSFVAWQHEKDNLLFQLNANEKDKDAILVSYSPESGKIEPFATIKDAKGNVLEIGKTDQLLFILRKEEGSYNNDIWSYDLKTKEFIKLTSDGKSKENLMFCR